jgi:hypothetical protein
MLGRSLRGNHAMSPSLRASCGVPVFAAALLAFCAGCTTLDLIKPPPRNDLYPAALALDAPLVLAIPGGWGRAASPGEEMKS